MAKYFSRICRARSYLSYHAENFDPENDLALRDSIFWIASWQQEYLSEGIGPNDARPEAARSNMAVSPDEH
jgi:hypothetical protein